ncbi:O-antigen ligase family protein [Mycobacterium sp. TJFP1]
MAPRPGDTAAQARSDKWFMPLAVLVGALAFLAYGISASSIAVMTGGAILGAAAMFLVPTRALPAIALWLLVLLPIGFMDIPGLIGDFFTPAVLVSAIWMIRLAFAQRMSLLLQMPIRGWLIAIPFVALLSMSTVASQRIDVTAVWIAVFVICVVTPALVGQICMDDVWPTVRFALASIGLFLGLLALSDFFFHVNPWLALYQDELIGSSVFRTRTSLGHPLTTAMVACISLTACVFPSGRSSRQWPYLLCGLGALTAVILSVSRTSIFTIGVAAAVGIASALPSADGSPAPARGSGGRLTLVILAITLFGAVALSPLMSQRNAASEGINSASYRSQVLNMAMDIVAERPLLGFGPGTSTRIYDYYARAPLENSALQLMVSIGIPAFVLFLIGLSMVVFAAMRRGRAGPAAGIVAFFISTAGFNIIDASPAFFALLSPLIVCAVLPAKTNSARSSAETKRDSTSASCTLSIVHDYQRRDGCGQSASAN